MKVDRKTKAETSPPKAKVVKTARRATAKSNGKHPLAAYEHIPIGIVETSLQGKYMDVNEEFCRILGYSRQELLQLGIKDCTHEDEYGIDSKLHEQLIAGKVPFYRLEKRFLRKGGGEIWVELTRSLVRSPRGKPLYTIGVVLDISERKDVERVLRDSVERLRLATGAAQMFMWEWDFQNRNYSLADNFEKVLGFSGGLLPRNNFDTLWGLSPREDLQRISEGFEEAVAHQSDLHALPYRVINPENGQIIWLEISAKIIYDHEGKPERMFGVAQNITERQKAEESLQLARRQAEQSTDRIARLQKVTAALSETITPSQVAEVLTRQGASAFGAVTSSMMLLSADGQNLEMMYSTSSESIVRPYHRFPVSLRVPAADAARSGQPVWIQSQQEYLERYPHLADQINLWGQQAALAIPMVHKERILGVLTLSFDRVLTYNLEDWDYALTLARQGAQALERARTEDALRVSEERFRALVGQATAGIAESDMDSRLIFVNPRFCEMLGYSEEELLGKTIWELTYTDDVEENKHLFQRMIAQGESYQFEKRFMRKDGSSLWTSVSVSTIRDLEGNPKGGVGVIIDIDERKRSEEALRSSEERMRLAIEANRMVAWEWDAVANRVTTSENFSEVYGRPALEGEETGFPLIWPEDLAAHHAKVDRAVGQGGEYYSEFRITRPEDGRTLWLEERAKALSDAGGKVNRLVGVVTDITERKQAEESLAEYARQQEALFNLSSQLHRADSLEAVFNAALEAILRSLQCDRASILLHDNTNVMRFVAWRGLSDAYRQATDGHSPWKPDAKDPQPVGMGDVRTADLDESLREIILGEGIGSLAFIPLISNGKLIGKFMIYFNTPHTFNEGEFDLSLTIAHQLAFGVERKRSEQALARERELLERLFETMPVIVSMYDSETNSMRLNAEFERQLGWKSEDVTVLSLLESLYPDPEYRDYVLQRMAQAGRNEWVEVRVQARDGRMLDSMWSNVSILDDQQLVTGIALGIDITERKQTEKRLALLAEVSELLRNVDDPNELMYTISKAVGEHLQVKRALFNEIDLEQDLEIVHRDYHNGLDSVAGTHKVSEYSSITSAEVAAGKTVINSDSKTDPRTAQEYEKTYALSGERSYVVIPMMRDNRWVASLWVSNDKPRTWSPDEVSLLETIAERTWTVIEKLRINAELRESEERLRATLETTVVGFATLTTDTRFVDVNDAFCRIVGYSREELLGMNCSVLTHPDFIESTSNHVAQLLGGELSSFVLEKIYIRKDGTHIWVQNSVSVMRDTGGTPLSLIVICQDVTERKRIEEALRIENERFMRFVDSNIVGILIGNAKGQVILANDYYLSLLGVSRQDLLEQKVDWKKFTPPEWLPADEKAIRELRENGVCEPYEKEYVRTDGTRIPVYITNAMLPGPGEEIAAFVLDITERKRAEEVMRRNEKMFSTLVDAAPFGVYFIDSEFRLRGINKGSEAVFSGIQPLIGRDFAEVLRIVWQEPFASEAIERFRHTLRTGESFLSPPVIEPRANVKEIQAYDWQIHRITLPDGTFGVVCYFYDLSEQKQMEATVRASEALYRAIARSIPGGGVYVVDKDFRYLVAEGPVTEAFGHSREMLEGHTIFDVFPGERAERMEVRLRQNFAGEVVSYETAHQGRVYWTQQAPLLDSIGQAIIVTMDITERKQAEEALRQSEERFARFMHHLPGLAWIKDMEGHYVYANVAAEQAFNTPREILYGRSDEDIFPPEVAAQYRRNDEQALTDEKGVQVVETLKHADGVPHYSLVSKFPIPGPDGSTALIGGTAFDITERLRAEEALRESEERFRAILRQATAGIARKDAEGRLLFVNQAFCNMLGYTESDLTGKPIWEFIHPDDVAENKRSYNRLMMEGIPFKLERRLLRQDGSILWVDASVSPIMDAAGKPQSAVTVEVDITGRKQAEEALQQLNLQLEERVLTRTSKLRSVNQALREEIEERQKAEAAARANEEKLSTLFELLPVGISFLDLDGRIIQMNTALTNILKLSKELLSNEASYRSRTYIRPNGLPMAPAEFASRRALTEGKTIYNVETGVVVEGGEVIWTSVSAAPVAVADVGAVVVTADITESKRAEKALQESRERLQMLSQRLVEVQEEERRSIARELHDRVGQTLAALNINLIIINGQLSPESVEQVGARLSDSMKLVAETISLVRDVMSNLRPSVLDDYGLEAAIESHVSQFTSRYEIAVKFEKPVQPIPRLGSSIEMTFLRIAQEALMNIARHAQATQINLSLWREADTICMVVQDNGTGITSWQEANRPGSHGLTIMRERAEAFGGNLKVSSTPGKGTKVEVKIPFEANNPPLAQKEKSQ